MAVHWVRLGIDPTGVPDAAASIDRRIGVDALAVMARARHADAVVVARHRGEIASDDRQLVLLPPAPQIGEDALGAVGRVDPGKALGLAIESVERRGRAVEPV